MSSAYWLVHAGITVAGRTPPRVRLALACGVTSAGYRGWRSKRLVTRENMATVLGLPVSHPDVRRAAAQSWRNYGRTATSLICMPSLDLADVDEHLRDLTEGMSWRECLRRATAHGRGTIITTGHVGSWDLAGALAARDVPLSAVADTFKDPRLNSLLQGYRRQRHVDVIPVPAVARRAPQELAAGRALAIVVDRPLPPGHGVEVTFFGRTAYVPAGAAALAVRSGAAVMPGYLWYAPDGGYYIRAFPPMVARPADTAEGRIRETRRLTQYLFDCQEEIVRSCPTQWFMFRRFWPRDDPSSVGEIVGGRAA